MTVYDWRGEPRVIGYPPTVGYGRLGSQLLQSLERLKQLHSRMEKDLLGGYAVGYERNHSEVCNEIVRSLNIMSQTGGKRVLEFLRILEDAQPLDFEGRVGMLLSIPLYQPSPNDISQPDLHIAVVVNSTPDASGARRMYLIRVDPAHRSVTDAVASTFGLSGGEYINTTLET
jgi:hypothetical protein